jgi:renalase
MLQNREWHYIIIGAGISGMTLAQRLRSKGLSVLILEKSKGVGGRMATRRWNDQLFDHGAQHIRMNPKTQSLLDQWSHENLLSPWQENSFICPLGISKLAKSMAAHLEIQLEKKVIHVQKIDTNYKLSSEDGSHFITKNLVLSSPLPQSLQLLSHSNINYDKKLESIQYAKALVFLVSHKSALNFQLPDYQEWNSGPLFSITNQNKKFDKPGFAFTFTMSPDWSDTHFELNDELLNTHFKQTLDLLKFQIPQSSELQIKKWRYSHPTSTWTDKFYTVENEKIELIGDAFGGPSINGAAYSALELKT